MRVTTETGTSLQSRKDMLVDFLLYAMILSETSAPYLGIISRLLGIRLIISIGPECT